MNQMIEGMIIISNKKKTTIMIIILSSIMSIMERHNYFTEKDDRIVAQARSTIGIHRAL